MMNTQNKRYDTEVKEETGCGNRQKKNMRLKTQS